MIVISFAVHVFCIQIDYGEYTSLSSKLLKSLSQNLSQGRGAGRRLTTPDADSLPNLETRNMRRPSSSSVAGGLPPLGRFSHKTLLCYLSLHLFIFLFGFEMLT